MSLFSGRTAVYQGTNRMLSSWYKAGLQRQVYMRRVSAELRPSFRTLSRLGLIHRSVNDSCRGNKQKGTIWRAASPGIAIEAMDAREKEKKRKEAKQQEVMQPGKWGRALT